MIGIVMLWPFMLHSFPELPDSLSYLPDLVIATSCVWLIPRLIARSGWTEIPVVHIFLFVSFLYVCIAGVVLNSVTGDTIFAGCRLYFRSLPLFLIPFAYAPAAEDYRKQAIVILIILLLQLPVTLAQRFLIYDGQVTGDNIRGTLTSTSSLSVLCAAAVAIVIGLVVQKRMRLTTGLLLALLLILPASLAETKATPIFLAVGSAAVVFVNRHRLRLRDILIVGIAGLTMFGVFVGLYDTLYKRDGDRGFFAAMSDSETALPGYTFKGIEVLPISIPIKERKELVAKETPRLSIEGPQLGRFDSISMPFQALWPDELSYLALGLGIGNVTTNFGSGADYFILEEYLHASHVTVSNMLWEVGVIGTLLFTLFAMLVLRTAMRKSRSSTGAEEAIFTSLASFAAIITLCLVYANLLHLPELMLLFAYTAGIVLQQHSAPDKARKTAGSKTPTEYLVQ